MPAERWLPVVGFEGEYEVSDWGNVRSLDRIIVRSDGRRVAWKGRVLKPTLTHPSRKKNYWAVNLGRRPVTIAKIVLLAFSGPKPFPKAVARHLNDEALDDRLVNLEWGTQKQNMEDMVRNGRHTPCRGERSGKAKLTDADVLAIRAEAARGRTITSLGEEFSISGHSISMIVTGRHWAHVGGEIRAPLAPGEVVARGEESGTAKLAESDVIAIREAYATGEVMQKTLALRYGVSKGCIAAIVHRRHWKHVA